MARCSRGGLLGHRLRQLISFLRRNRLHATAHVYALVHSRPPTAILLIGKSPDRLHLRINRRLKRQSGVFFDTAYLRRMLLDDRWAAASSYSLHFVTFGDLSPEANSLIISIFILPIIADFAMGQAHSIDWLFQYIYANLDGYKECQTVRKLLLSMRSDETKCVPLLLLSLCCSPY
jgi:hypothetical protein